MSGTHADSINEKYILPEGVYLAEFLRVEQRNDFLLWQFRILQIDLEDPYVTVVSRIEINQLPRLLKWQLVFHHYEVTQNMEHCMDEFNLDHAGSHCFVKVVRQEKNGFVRSNVEDVYKHNDERFTYQRKGDSQLWMI